jgi:hypothetical protein
MDEVPVNLSNSKTRRTTQLMRLARNRTRGKVGPYIRKIQPTISNQQLVNYMNTQNESGKNVFSYAEEGNLRFLKSVYATAKTADSNVAQLFEEFSKTPTTSPRYEYIVNRLKTLASTKPYEFLHYDGLFAGLQKIINDKVYPSDKPVSYILERCSKMQHQKSFLLGADEKFVDKTAENTDRLHKYVMMALGLLKNPIFDMPTIMADEKTHVYALMGHACVHVDDSRIEVPPGVIWIETALCGRYSYTNRIDGFITADMKRFFEETPIPTDEAARSAYRNFIFKSYQYYMDVKFPGDTIASGSQTFQGEVFDVKTSLSTGEFFKSGIHRLYNTDKLNLDEYTREYWMKDYDFKSKSGKNAFFSQVYKDSIYPTVEQVVQNNPTSSNYRIEFEDLFSRIRGQSYTVGDKPLVLINIGCRSPCGHGKELNRPALRRANSLETQKEIISKLTSTNELLSTKKDGKTRLMFLIEEGIFEAAKLLVERLATTTTPTQFLTYLCKQTTRGLSVFHLLAKYDAKAREENREIVELTEVIESKLMKIIPVVSTNLLTVISAYRLTLLHEFIKCRMFQAATLLIHTLESRLISDAFFEFLRARAGFSFHSVTALELANSYNAHGLAELIQKKFAIDDRRQFDYHRELMRYF